MELRTIEKFVDEEWVVARMEDLKEGDKFRIFETDYDPEDTDQPHWHDPNTLIFEGVALSDAYFIKNNGVWGIDVHKGNEDEMKYLDDLKDALDEQES